MLKKFNIGIMGAGNIAGVMAETVKKMNIPKVLERLQSNYVLESEE